jgi:hypothetical protein
MRFKISALQSFQGALLFTMMFFDNRYLRFLHAHDLYMDLEI